MTLLGGLLIGSCACMLGVIIGGLMAGGKCEDLQRQIDAKRESWCGDCRFKLDAKAFDELLLHERRSKWASIREKDKKILELAAKLNGVQPEDGNRVPKQKRGEGVRYDA